MYPPILPLLLLLLPNPTTSYFAVGTIDTMESWKFVDRFCFVPHEMEIEMGQGVDIEEAREYGLFQWSVTFPEDMDLYLQVFYQKHGLDTWDDKGWGSVYNPEREKEDINFIKSCSQRHYYAAKSFRLKNHHNTHKIVTRSEKNMATNGFAYFKTTAPKFFFVAVSNCNPQCACSLEEMEGDPDNCVPSSTSAFCDGPLVLDYTFEFTNGVKPSNKHFGFDEIGLMQIAWVFSAFYLFLVFLANKTVRDTLIKKDRYHVTVKILVYSIWVMAGGVGCMTYHYMSFSEDGVGDPDVLLFGKTLSSLGEVLLVLHLIFIAKGWTIVRRKISANGRMKIALYITVFSFMHMATRYYSRKYMDRGVILYDYETTPGMLLRIGRVFATVWFVYSVRTTIKQFPRSKQRFYRNFSSIFGLWFFWMCILSYLPDGIPDYMRNKFSVAFELSMIFAAQLILVIMYNPKLSANFPFHSNATHEIMTGKFNKESFRRELEGNNRRRNNRRKDYGFETESGTAAATASTLSSQSPSNLSPAPASVPPTSENPNPTQPNTPSPTPASPIAALFAGKEIPVQPHYAFSSVAEATAAVRVAGDDISEVLHVLASNLEVLDDAMDDWDEDIGGEVGEDYEPTYD